MERHFNTHLEGIDLQFWCGLIESRGRLVTFNKDDLLCRQGYPSDIFGMVKSGYFIYENNMAVGRPSLVGGFAFPGALVGNYPDCMENATAPFDIRAGRKSEVWIMDGKLLPDIYDSDPDACRQGRILTEQSYKSLRQRYMDLCINTPAERYLNLIRRHPQIEQDIPQKWIAKYLQISPVHLCRIRKEQMKQQ